MLCDVDEAGLAATVAAVGDERAVAQVADVRSLEAMQDVVRAGIARFGGIDVVVANAGIGSFGSVLNVDPEAFRRVLDVNLLGVFHTVRAALPSVIERQGYVLVVSSLAAFTASPGMAAYHASKAGAENFANALRLEVSHLGVHVGSAHMSWIDTPMVSEARTELSGFDRMIKRLPPPLNRTTDLASCVDAFVDGIARRRRRVFVPGWVGTISRLRGRAQHRRRRPADPQDRAAGRRRRRRRGRAARKVGVGPARRHPGLTPGQDPSGRASAQAESTRPLVGTPVPAVTSTWLDAAAATGLTEVPRTWRTASAMPFMPWM